ncbi:ABC transporter permease [Nitratireductor kimnyeongensis]|uniref:ABC transporter permease n=1 Tax=Nitratireductor kimnyeongensis TaxID=430679 RepID=A0ABW0T4Q5_9HYPH|nr:ABC transporter permease [Nitratireductor kimnyeongensis]QZZ35334.1 ABC transporter permease [Nitratireductor kimnyeongensis]
MTLDTPPPEAAPEPHFLQMAFANRSFVIGVVITVLIAAVALLSFVWTPYDITHLVVADRMKGLSLAHPLGTDHLGRDILSMIMIGARNSIAVAIVAVGIGMGIGVPLGTWAAARGGVIDELLMRFNDLVFAFPALLSAIMITAIFGPGAINAIIAIGIFNVPVFARVARAGALSIWPREYILAARAAGKSKALITIEHILPNIVALLLVQGTIQFALGILAEAGLSYLGLGAQPPMPSWGRMLFEAQTRMMIAPHLAIFPGLAIVITVLGLNLLGDGLRDLLDPRLRRER